MIRRLDPEQWQIRSHFLRDVRCFFFERDYVEVETPLLNRAGGSDPFLDPFVVRRSAARRSPQASPESSGTAASGHLVTSPEYNLKSVLAQTQDHVFQIAHCFREGDSGDLHSEEFLMLEWYRRGADEFELMDECQDLLVHLSRKSYATGAPPEQPALRQTIEQLFQDHLQCGLQRAQLEDQVLKLGLLGQGEQPGALRYDELFFTLFLNRIEPGLGHHGPHFVHDYPAELAALAVVEGNIARRFEIYWRAVELANGYFELLDSSEQRQRFAKDNALRRSLGKPEMSAEPQFVETLDQVSKVSGVALGLDRLLMVLQGEEKLDRVSPFPAQGF